MAIVYVEELELEKASQTCRTIHPAKSWHHWGDSSLKIMARLEMISMWTLLVDGNRFVKYCWLKAIKIQNSYSYGKNIYSSSNKDGDLI